MHQPVGSPKGALFASGKVIMAQAWHRPDAQSPIPKELSKQKTESYFGILQLKL